MKPLALSLVAAALVVSGVGYRSNTSQAETRRAASSATATASDAQSFTGEVMDGPCAAMGSHDAMMKQENAKDAKDCTLKCVAAGARLALYDATTKTAYQLDDQAKAKEFAGQKVKVTGTYDKKTQTIHVQDIGPSS